MTTDLNARINARQMPRERVEHAVRELALLTAAETRIYESARRAHMDIAEARIARNWGVHREDVGVDGHELDRVIARDAWQAGTEAVARVLPDLDGRRDYLTALRDHALSDWAAQLGMPVRARLLSHLRFDADRWRDYSWLGTPYIMYLRYTVLGCRAVGLKRRALPAPERAA
ncbi:hypothetical protein GCM10017784_35280 [Deinococcus indicus]|uniref:hypothetical protein n=1 Tax=Deinococcus indicus TaxID=223556 RepID=UPI00174E2D35|nr:hypothetical protein [Deinococcus indicus]GHG37765.1 hypothetical protein GCM10017784_35280 [Deinococcus indicus]